MNELGSQRISRDGSRTAPIVGSGPIDPDNHNYLLSVAIPRFDERQMLVTLVTPASFRAKVLSQLISAARRRQRTSRVLDGSEASSTAAKKLRVI